GFSHTDGVTDVAAPTLQGVATDTGGTGVHPIEVKEGASSLGFVDMTNNYNATTGAWTFTPATGFADGTHNLSIVVTDAAGNFVNTNYSVTIDTGNPETSILSSTVADGSTTSSTSATFNWAGTDTLSGVVGYQYSTDGGTTWSAQTTNTQV